jgi:sec-independent protein translocase protein TatB
MFDIAPTELLVCAVIALVVIGPKDLPNALRFVGRWVGKARRMAGTFRTGIDTMMREAELKEMEEKWRAHNEAIMQAHPQMSMDYTASAPTNTPSMSAPIAEPPTVTPPAAQPAASPVTPVAEP